MKNTLLLFALMMFGKGFAQNQISPDTIQIVKSRFIFNRYVYLLNGKPIDIVKMDSLFLKLGNSEAMRFQKKAKVNALLSKSFAYLTGGSAVAVYAVGNNNPSLRLIVANIFSGSFYVSIYSSLRRTYVEKKAVQFYNKAINKL